MKALRLQDKLGKQNSHEDTKKVSEVVTETINDVSDDVTKTKTETSKGQQSTIEFKRQTLSNTE